MEGKSSFLQKKPSNNAVLYIFQCIFKTNSWLIPLVNKYKELLKNSQARYDQIVLKRYDMYKCTNDLIFVTY